MGLARVRVDPTRGDQNAMPTNAGHLNRIECHFWTYVEFVINGSDYDNWTEFSKATPGLRPSTRP